MKEQKTITVYEPVDQDSPFGVSVWNTEEWCFKTNVVPINNLIRVNGVLGTREAIEKFAGDNFEKGRSYQQGEHNEYHGGGENTRLNKTAFINSLFNDKT